MHAISLLNYETHTQYYWEKIISSLSLNKPKRRKYNDDINAYSVRNPKNIIWTLRSEAVTHQEKEKPHKVERRGKKSIFDQNQSDQTVRNIIDMISGVVIRFSNKLCTSPNVNQRRQVSVGKDFL